MGFFEFPGGIVERAWREGLGFPASGFKCLGLELRWISSVRDS